MSYTHITTSNRILIENYLKNKYSLRQIAQQIDKSHTAVALEVKRNSIKGEYSWRLATKNTQDKRLKANQRFHVLTQPQNLQLSQLIEKKLKDNWSPEQISGWLKIYQHVIIAIQTIYDWIYKFRQDLTIHLHHIKGRYRHKRQYYLNQKIREIQKDTKYSIDLRPAHIKKRKQTGHWEGDTIVGTQSSGRIITLVERKTGFLMAKIIHPESTDILKTIDMTELEIQRKTISLKFADGVTELFNQQILPKYQRTLTLDNGSEMAGFEWITRHTINHLKIYFAHPYHSWERGTNENTNGLLRFYFPKKMKFTHITQQMLDKAVREINNRPRKRLNYRTPQMMMCGKLGSRI
jgi:IS30 family transposase